ncbi:MAG: hypothetical protein R2697_19890 [Ilumatobacteraceae bacterium]
MRLFLFFVPLILFSVGLAGIVARLTGYDVLVRRRHHGHDRRPDRHSVRAGGASAWFVCLAGLVGMATAGYSLSRALIVSSALSWKMGGKQKTTFGVIGTIVGLIACIGLVAAIINSIRVASGVAVASMSFVVVAAIYVVLWIFVYQTLPRATTDPGASLPVHCSRRPRSPCSRRSARCTCRVRSSARRSSTARSASPSRPSVGSTCSVG